MTAIVHRTKGLIDIRSFTIMGMSAKLGDNPIGQFGTGLKYAIAVLVRAGAKPVVWIGRDRYEFFCEPTDFRGKAFQLIRMRVKKWGGLRSVITDLPFTTEYGKNWKMWMAYRELESNTRDESGFTDELPEEAGLDVGQEGFTTIVIDHPEYTEAHLKQAETFLPGGQSVREGSEGLQVIEEPSQVVYFRGLRAMDLPKPTLATWNVLSDILLTEDRTIMYPHQVREAIARHVLKSDDEDLIEKVLKADEEHFEHNIDFPQYIQPGDAFRRVMARRPKGVGSSAHGYYARYDTSVVVTAESIMDSHRRPWKIVGTEVRDADGKIVFEAPYGYKGRWEVLAKLLLDRIFGFTEGQYMEAYTEFGQALFDQEQADREQGDED